MVLFVGCLFFRAQDELNEHWWGRDSGVGMLLVGEEGGSDERRRTGRGRQG